MLDDPLYDLNFQKQAKGERPLKPAKGGVSQPPMVQRQKSPQVPGYGAGNMLGANIYQKQPSMKHHNEHVPVNILAPDQAI